MGKICLTIGLRRWSDAWKMRRSRAFATARRRGWEHTSLQYQAWAAPGGRPQL
jgi:hypothetical protein